MNAAQMVAPRKPTETAPSLRREFVRDDGHGAVERATRARAALCVVEAWVNGMSSSDELVAPMWTSYEWPPPTGQRLVARMARFHRSVCGATLSVAHTMDEVRRQIFLTASRA